MSDLTPGYRAPPGVVQNDALRNRGAFYAPYCGAFSFLTMVLPLLKAGTVIALL